MLDYIKQNHLSLVIILFLVISGFFGGETFGRASTTITNPWTFEQNVTIGDSSADTLTVTATPTFAQNATFSGSITAATTTATGPFQQGGDNCTLTDANGGAYVLTEAQMLHCSMFEFAAGGGGQAVIALTFPATSTMTTLIPSAGDCRTWLYDASALAAATTTTFTAGTGHDVIAYTTNDDVIDGGEYGEIKMCRASSTDVKTIVSELVEAD